MRQLISCLLAGLFLPAIVVSQCPDEWVRQISGLPEGDYQIQRQGMALDPNGNILISGSSSEVVDLTIGPENYQYPNGGPLYYSLFLTKLNDQGDVIWTKVIESESNAYDLVVLSDSNGGSYIGGSMRTQLTVDATTISRPANSSQGFYLIRFNESGEVSWSLSGPLPYSLVRSAAKWGGDIVVCIPFQQSLSISGQVFNADVSSNSGNQDVLIARISPDGELVSTYLVSGKGNLDVRAINCDQYGCIVQGKFDHELIYGNDTLTTIGPDHYSMYQIAIDNEGFLQWANVSQNPNDMYVYCYGLGFTDNGEVHFSGVYDYSSFTLGNHSLPMPQERDVFVGSLDRITGEVLWLKKGNGSMSDFTETHDVVDNESMLAGSFYSSQFEFEGETFSNTDDDQFDGFIVSLDSTGKARCGLSFHGVGQNGVRAVKKTTDGHILALVSMEQLDFAGQSYTAQGRFDLLLIKTCLPCDTLTFMAETTGAQPRLQVYPNPANQSIRVEATGNNQQLTAITITDMLGHAILHQQTQGHEQNIDISRLANGIYTIAAMLGNGETRRERLVVQR
ncbi:MAG: T9SS type A sorting domain-containing protein [Flavobacteriales bacterium]|nr:T9SS type A sorting domain-containing protein [Flavobacteriales bacterium]